MTVIVRLSHLIFSMQCGKGGQITVWTAVGTQLSRLQIPHSVKTAFQKKDKRITIARLDNGLQKNSSVNWMQ